MSLKWEEEFRVLARNCEDWTELRYVSQQPSAWHVVEAESIIVAIIMVIFLCHTSFPISCRQIGRVTFLSALSSEAPSWLNSWALRLEHQLAAWLGPVASVGQPPGPGQGHAFPVLGPAIWSGSGEYPFFLFDGIGWR